MDNFRHSILHKQSHDTGEEYSFAAREGNIDICKLLTEELKLNVNTMVKGGMRLIFCIVYTYYFPHVLFDIG